MTSDTDLREMDAEDARAERRLPARTCLECGCRGYHTQNCPCADDAENEQETSE